MKYIKKHWLRILGIEVLFMGLAYFTVCLLIKSGYISSGADNIFHWQRFLEITHSLGKGQLPQFNNYTNVPYGLATPTMYPWLNLLPFIIIYTITHKAVTIIYAIIIVWTFAGLSIAYWSSRSLNNRISICLLFSFLYVISSRPFGEWYVNGDIGAFTAELVAPMVIAGFFRWLHNKQAWKMMTIGLVIMMGCHVLSTIIMIVSLGVLLIVEHSKLKEHLQSAIKAIVVFMSVSSIFWIPTMILMCSNTIQRPMKMLFTAERSNMMIPQFTTLLTPFKLQVWTYSDLVCIILVLIYWKHISTRFRKLFWVAIAYIFCNFNWLPWNLIQRTPLSELQYIDRINFISHILLSYILSQIIVKILFKRWYIQNAIAFITVFVMFLTGCIFVSQMECNIFTEGYPISKSHPIPKSGHSQVSPQFMQKHHTNPNSKLFFRPKLNNRSLAMKPMIHVGFYYDYAPKYLVNSENEQAFIFNNGHKHFIKTRPKYGFIKIKNYGSSENVIMPYVLYNQQNYKVYVNGKRTSFSRYKNRLMIRNMHGGKYNIRVVDSIMWYRWLSFGLTLLGLLYLIFSEKNFININI